MRVQRPAATSAPEPVSREDPARHGAGTPRASLLEMFLRTGDLALVLLVAFSLSACGGAGSPASPERGAGDAEASDGASTGDAGPSPEAEPTTVLTLSPNPGRAIDPRIYGVNYDWNFITPALFTAYDQFMRGTAGYHVARYPGGWNAEHYDWSTNTEQTWAHYNGGPPGVSPSVLLATVPSATFISPSADAVADASRAAAVAAKSAALAAQYAGKVSVWEIGNEWWLQGGAKNDPIKLASNLKNYAALVAAAAPAMKNAAPGIEVYASADWRTAGAAAENDQFAALRLAVGDSAWASVDGISIHSYCGTDPTQPNTLCAALPARVAAIRTATGKDKIFASEWAATRDNDGATATTPDESYGIRNTNALLVAFGLLAKSGVTMATYWPSVMNEVPQIALASADYSAARPNGVLFGWLSRDLEGHVINVSGELPAVAAKSIEGAVTLFVAAGDTGGPRTVQVPLAALGLSSASSAQVLYSSAPDDPAGSEVPRTAALPVTVAQGTASFVVNPGTPGRGAAWEVARVTFSP